jgi:hypothetical protein
VYCETGLNIDNANIVGQANSDNSNTTTWCSREGRAYFGNNDVEIRLGRQNVWWTQGELNQMGSTYLGSDSMTNLINGANGVYTGRGENMVKLLAGAGMGAFAGSEFYVGYMGASGASTVATNQANATQGEAAGANTSPKGKYFGGKLQYTQGAIIGMIDFQNSSNQLYLAGTSAATNFDRSSTKYGLGYKYNAASLVSLQYWTKKRTDNAGTQATTNVFGINPTGYATYASGNTQQTGDASDTGWGLNVKHDLGNGLMVHGQWAKASNVKDYAGNAMADTGAVAYSLGLTKAFSKRTHLYTAYHTINNQNNAAYNMTGGSYNSGTSNLGADVKMMSLGMIHNF